MFSEKPNIAASPEFELYVAYNLELPVRAMSSSDSGTSSDSGIQTNVHGLEDGKLNELDAPHEALALAAPRLFLFLPSDPELWDDLDPSTHSFRLYFLCDCHYESTEERYPTVHISNHPGYDLKHPQEFIRRFGYLSLLILEAVKTGYSGNSCCFPPLDTFQILRTFGRNPIRHDLKPATLESLVDKTIAYIHEPRDQDRQPKQSSNHYLRSIVNVVGSCFQRQRNQESPSNVSMDRSDAWPIRSFLRLSNGDNGMGDLTRVLFPSTVRWLCRNHAFITSDIEVLEQFVQSRGGSIDL